MKLTVDVTYYAGGWFGYSIASGHNGSALMVIDFGRVNSRARLREIIQEDTDEALDAFERKNPTLEAR